MAYPSETRMHITAITVCLDCQWRNITSFLRMSDANKWKACGSPQVRFHNRQQCSTQHEIDLLHDELRKHAFTYILSWTEEEGGSHLLGGTANRLVRFFFFCVKSVVNTDTYRKERDTPGDKSHNHPYGLFCSTFLQAKTASKDEKNKFSHYPLKLWSPCASQYQNL